MTSLNDYYVVRMEEETVQTLAITDFKAHALRILPDQTVIERLRSLELNFVLREQKSYPYKANIGGAKGYHNFVFFVTKIRVLFSY